MFHRLGFVSLSLPPLIVFILVFMEVVMTLTVPVSALVAIYPVGILTLVVYSLSIGSGASVLEHYTEFTQGARSATFYVFFGSVVVSILPVYLGEPLVGVGLLSVSLGSLWLPSASIAGAYGSSLMLAPDQLKTPENRGTTHRGIAALFLALFLDKRDFIRGRWKVAIFIMDLGGFYVLGWVLLSQAGGFPVTLIGLSMIVLVPLSSYKVFTTMIKPSDRARIKDILKSPSSAPTVTK